MTTETAQIHARTFEEPDETRGVPGMALYEIISVGGVKATRGTMQPGFHWTEHARPIVGTDLCQAHHVGYVVSGRARTRLADGTEREVSAGDIFDVPPGHDTWVLGDEPYVSIEIDRSGE